MAEHSAQAGTDDRPDSSIKMQRKNTTSTIDKIVEQEEEADDLRDAGNVYVPEPMMLAEFGKDKKMAIQIPPDSELRSFNVNDILGDLDRDEKGNIIMIQDNDGNNIDKQGNPTNIRGYRLDPRTNNVIENMGGKTMFEADKIDERGEIPAPYCVEKFNFNPHDLMGDLDFDFDKKTNMAIPRLFKTKQGFFMDKRNRRVNKFGWLIQGGSGHIVDKVG
jgi:hypothetical protein